MAFENCSFEPSGRLLESVSNYRSRWMVIRSQERQDPAYRATLLYFYVVTHEVMRDTHNIYVEQLAAPRLKQLHLVGRFVGNYLTLLICEKLP